MTTIAMGTWWSLLLLVFSVWMIAEDEVIAYTDDVPFPNVIIRKGNIVIKASFYQGSESYTMPIEEWAEIICSKLK